MKTIQELYQELNDEEIVCTYDQFVGEDVKLVEYKDNEEFWSKKDYTISEFIEDACGDGCCSAFKVVGVEDLSYRSDQLLVVEPKRISALVAVDKYKSVFASKKED